MKEFNVYVQNKPGELAKVCEMLGSNGVNIKAIASERAHERPMIRIVTDDEVTTRSTLSRSGIGYDLREVIVVKMPDRPGELGKIARRLARAMVNVESIYILGKAGGMADIVITVDDSSKAESALR